MASSRVFVGRLPRGCRERDLETFFRRCGRIREVVVKRGFAFVEFEDARDAEDACYDMNGRTLHGERMTVEIATGRPKGRDRDGGRDGGSSRGGGGGRGRYDRSRSRSRDRGGRYDNRGKFGPPKRTDFQITVDNLSSRVSWQDLKDYMREAGEVTYADAHKLKKNHGVVEFCRFEDMQRAVDKFDGKELNGRKLQITITKKSSASRRSRSRSGSDRSRSRSNSRKRSASRSRSGSRDGKRARSGSKSRSRSRERRSRTKSPVNGEPRKSRSRSASHASRSRSASPANGKRSRSRSKSADKSD